MARSSWLVGICPTGAVAFRFFVTIEWQFHTNRPKGDDDRISCLKRKIVKMALGQQKSLQPPKVHGLLRNVSRRENPRQFA
jgi:hypothetical protein